MTITPFSADEWRNIWRGYKDSNPSHQIAIEILRQHLEEDVRVDSTLMSKEATWYKHFKHNPNVYFP